MNKDFQILKGIQEELLKEISLDFKRDYFDTINWEEKVVGLIGERGVGKTTIMLQKIKETKEGFYFSADNSITKINGLFKFCYYIYSEYSIKTFYIDEIHKYENWTQEVKNIYDSMPNVKIIFSGSSSLDLYAGVLDLSRRVDFYNIFPLNYREFLKLFYLLDIPSFEFDEIMQNHKKISLELSSITKDKYFEEYINFGYYPFSKAITSDSFTKKIQVLLDKIIIEDLPVFLDFKNMSFDGLRKLFYFISNTSPSELSFTNLGNKVGLNKIIIQNTLVLLNKIGLVALIPKFGNISDRVRKEYKIILGNPNLYNAYSKKTDIGILRESFFVSQLRKVKDSDIFLPKAGDFVLERFDEVFYFEVGGKSKMQSSYPKNTFIVKDDIKISENDYIIPLWLFGLIK